MINEHYLSMLSNKSVIRNLSEYATARGKEIGYENVFDFSLGNPSVPAPQSFTDTALDLLKNMEPLRLHGYSPTLGIPEVKDKVAASLNRRFDMNYTGNHIFPTSGAAGALAHALRAVTKPGDEVLVFAPYFPEYQVFIEAAGGVFRLIPADIEEFQIDFDRFEETLNEKTKAVLINSPNNPSGAVYSEATIRRLAAVLEEKSAQYGHAIYLITDEPYRAIAFNGVTVPYVPKYYKNTLVCYSWSKALSVPGERMGYVLVSDQMEEHDLVYAAIAGAGRSLGYVSAPSLFQRVCAECADDTSDISVYEKNKEILVSGLRDLGFFCVEPQGTFYMFPRTLIPDDIAFCEKAKDFNLLIVPGTGFGCPGHARISYCVPTERAERSLEAFAKLAAAYR